MNPVKIVSDSTCDLSAELTARYHIEIVPLYINLGGRVLRDGEEVTAADIYEFVRQHRVLPGTVASTVEDFRRAFQKWHGLGYDIVCHTISSEMSCSCQNAHIAAEGLPGIHVVDSRNLSTGIGQLAVRSARMAAAGLPAQEIVRATEALIPRVRASFILDNLDYMRRGGRCSSVMALGANLLHIKPEIVVENGAMRLGAKFRGPLPRVLDAYVDRRLQHPETISPDLIFITHTGCAPEIVARVRARIESRLHFDEIAVTQAGGTVTSHSGPDTLGILYVEKAGR